MKPLTIGSVTLGQIPRVVAIIDEFMDMHRIEQLAQAGVDILEIRFDLISADIPSLRAYVDKIKKTTSFPCICTIRETAENRETRMDMFKAVLPFVDAVDIEIDASINRQVIAHAAGKTVIVSEHDFGKTPDIAHLESIAENARSLGADIVKIAAMAHNRHDVARLLTFASGCDKPLVVIAMGGWGAVSRVLAPVFGSLFAYGYVNESVAPGQLPIGKLVEELRLYYPELGQRSGPQK